MMKCWKATIRLVGGGGCSSSSEQREGYLSSIGNTRKGVVGTAPAHEAPMVWETSLVHVAFAVWDSVRLQPGAWRCVRSAVEGVPWCDDLQQQHSIFVAFTPRHGPSWKPSCRSEPSQQVRLQQQALAPMEMPRQNSFRFPFGQTH
jgi:hypothetical protein